jgi:hypothetical protein
MAAFMRNAIRVYFDASIGCAEPSRPQGRAIAPKPRTSGISPNDAVSNDSIPFCTAKFDDLVAHHCCWGSKSSGFE